MLLHLTATHLLFLLVLGRNISRTSHLITSKSNEFLNLCQSSLITAPVTAPLFPRDFRENSKTNGVPKWWHI